jgi:hypothetical protein
MEFMAFAFKEYTICMVGETKGINTEERNVSNESK